MNVPIRIVPNYLGIRELLRQTRPSINNNLAILLEDYNITKGAEKILWENIDLLVDVLGSELGVPNCNHKVYAGLYAYTIDCYTTAIINNFATLEDKFIAQGLTRDDLEFKIDYLSQSNAQKLVSGVTEQLYSVLNRRKELNEHTGKDKQLPNSRSEKET